MLFGGIRDVLPQLDLKRLREQTVTVTGYASVPPKTGTSSGKPTSENIYKRVDQMPRFPGCADLTDEKAARNCSQKQVFGFIDDHRNYPAEARTRKIEGTVVVTFVVEPNGELTDVKLLRDPGGGIGAEAVRLVRAMPRWTPGRQDGRAVRVQYTMPMRFRLEE